MKLIIAGGRDYQFNLADYNLLSELHARAHITEVVSGGAQGADKCGEKWARRIGIHVKKFVADWEKHGKAAGPIRNRQMAEYADAAILFPGNVGTSNMRVEALKAGLVVYDYSQDGAVERE
jgi:hypothetical protein